ncbi:C-type lectin domain family 4 member G-like isoform X1 [Catharus ustulatus]|uniref:C-type lectin domain family 4 member G-like isoform X2 n=1 Tax=Catharus ustulatus TaxID=91951 RepID=UPI00140D2E52|nr:C-type lectin domain family 4 member G-like isoform X2 [Catharus ustulatus]XP_032939678.1 C-type lectin domain family 4 member G-like isoform X1 [Catharus ustulatus]
MALQETYGNWLGPERLRRQPGIYSVASKMSPVGDFRPGSPDSFEDDYDDVSMAGSEQGPPAKGVYLLAGPPGSSRAPSLQDPENLELKSPNPDPKSQNPDPKSRNPDPKSRNPDPKSRHCRRCWNSVAVLALLVASSALLWGGLLAAALGKHTELRAELEQLRSNLSEIWDLVQQEQTRLQFGIHQHQQELHELSEVLCGAVGSSRRCGAGWQSHARSCFSFSRRSLSWGAARNACADLGAHLAVVSDEAEQEFLLQHSQRGFSYWLGLAWDEQGSTWSWVNGDELNFRFWDVWLQDPERELKKCGSIGGQGRWVQQKCTGLHRWICEKAANC